MGLFRHRRDDQELYTGDAPVSAPGMDGAEPTPYRGIGAARPDGPWPAPPGAAGHAAAPPAPGVPGTHAPDGSSPPLRVPGMPLGMPDRPSGRDIAAMVASAALDALGQDDDENDGRRRARRAAAARAAALRLGADPNAARRRRSPIGCLLLVLVIIAAAVVGVLVFVRQVSDAIVGSDPVVVVAATSGAPHLPDGSGRVEITRPVPVPVR